MSSFYQESFSKLSVKKDDTILWLELDNPESSNAITLEVVESLTRVLSYADFDPEIRVIILAGKGKVFCSGGDVKAMVKKEEMFAGDSNELRMRYMHGIQKIPKCIEDMSTPIIAMIDGAAVGAGCDIAMMCDLRVGSEKAKFGETFAKVGLVPGDGGSYFLQRVVGYSKAMQMTLLADFKEGKDAYEFGLMNFFVSSTELEAKTREIAQKIAQNAPIAVQMSKKNMKMAYENSMNSVLDYAAALQGIAQRSQDHFRALESFQTKTPPQFKGN